MFINIIEMVMNIIKMFINIIEIIEIRRNDRLSAVQ